MRIALVALGSAGDVHPFVGIGRALAARGHEVVVFAAELFADVVEGAGLGFRAALKREQYEGMTQNPELWHPRRGFHFVMQGAVLPHMRDLARALLAEQPDVIAASTLDLTGRVVREKHGVPLATVHLAPAALRTCYRVPVFFRSGIPQWAPAAYKRAIWWIADKILDPAFVPELNAWRKELDLPPVRRPLNGWWNSPDRILGLFPGWFAPSQPDWPEQLRLTGFPLFDEADLRPVDTDLQAWLSAAAPPVVFTAGSAMHLGDDFFRHAVDACGHLGRRGLLLSPAPETIPRDLPPTVRHCTYAPFSRLLPRAAALVSHGGIGTCAQALAAGVPHLAMPMAHDQFDNASRLVDLGVGGSLYRGRFTGARAARLLRRLLDDAEVGRRCRALRERLDGADAAAAACDAIEGLGS